MQITSLLHSGVLVLASLHAAAAASDDELRSLTATQCDCGYVDEQHVWSEMWHADFADVHAEQRLKDIFVASYNIEAKYEGTHDRNFASKNVHLDASGGGGLVVDVTVDGDAMRCGGFGTQRRDFLYGSFRAHVKTTAVNGTVSAMYLYNTDQEIDIEILSAVAPPQAYFAIHPGLLENGRASHLTHDNHHLNYAPSAEYHEYRFDWSPGLVVFYVDGAEARRMTTNIPSRPTRFMFNHWSDGNPKFSMGPPTENAMMQIMNITAFFNYSQPADPTTTVRPSCQQTQKACSIPGIMDYLRQNIRMTQQQQPSPLPPSSANTSRTNTTSKHRKSTATSAASRSSTPFTAAATTACILLFIAGTTATFSAL